MLSIESYHEGTARILIAAGVDIHLADEAGNTALLLSMQKGQKETFELLIANGAQINFQETEDRDEALINAVRIGN